MTWKGNVGPVVFAKGITSAKKENAAMTKEKELRQVAIDCLAKALRSDTPAPPHIVQAAAAILLSPARPKPRSKPARKRRAAKLAKAKLRGVA